MSLHGHLSAPRPGRVECAVRVLYRCWLGAVRVLVGCWLSATRVLVGCWLGADCVPHTGPARGAPMELLGGPELADLVASLPGFLLAVTREGKLVGVTDNVAQHLGHSMVGTCVLGWGWVLGAVALGCWGGLWCCRVVGAGCQGRVLGAAPHYVPMQVNLVAQGNGCWGVLGGAVLGGTWCWEGVLGEGAGC